jgi:hypothetical protein
MGYTLYKLQNRTGTFYLLISAVSFLQLLLLPLCPLFLPLLPLLPEGEGEGEGSKGLKSQI